MLAKDTFNENGIRAIIFKVEAISQAFSYIKLLTNEMGAHSFFIPEASEREREMDREGDGKGLKLFGVRIGEVRVRSGVDEEEEVMRKSSSMGNLAAAEPEAESGAGDHGYLSDGGLIQSSRRRVGHERKRGVGSLYLYVFSCLSVDDLVFYFRFIAIEMEVYTKFLMF